MKNYKNKVNNYKKNLKVVSFFHIKVTKIISRKISSVAIKIIGRYIFAAGCRGREVLFDFSFGRFFAGVFLLFPFVWVFTFNVFFCIAFYIEAVLSAMFMTILSPPALLFSHLNWLLCLLIPFLFLCMYVVSFEWKRIFFFGFSTY